MTYNKLKRQLCDKPFPEAFADITFSLSGFAARDAAITAAPQLAESALHLMLKKAAEPLSNVCLWGGLASRKA